MKRTKMERMVQELLAVAGKPLSRRELEAVFPYRFVPSAVIILSLESLQRKGLAREAGFSNLGRCQEERLYAVCPPGAVEKDH